MPPPSNRNFGTPPRTVQVGGRNFQPDAGNPDLWPVYNDRGQRRINARIRPENTRLMGGGLDAFKLVNSPYGRSRGVGFKQADATVQEMRRGLSDPNRPLFDLNPYRGGDEGGGRRRNRLQQSSPSAQPPAMEDENGEPFNPENPIAPPASSAAPMIADPRLSLQSLADEIASRRQFNSGSAPATFSNPMESPNADEMNPQPIMGSKFGRYGSGSSLIASPGAPPVTSGGMMPNPITGQMTKMNPYLQEQRAVQDTKFSPESQGAKRVASQFSNTKPLDAEKGAYFRNKVRGAI